MSGSGLGQALSFPNLYPPFESTDYTTWGWEEYGILGLLAYGVISAALDLGKGTKRAAKGAKKRYRKAKKKGYPVALTILTVAAVGGVAAFYLLTQKPAATGAGS